MYIKLHKVSWIKLIKFTKIWSPQNELTYPTVQTVTDNKININIPYIWPAFLSVNKWINIFVCIN